MTPRTPEPAGAKRPEWWEYVAGAGFLGSWIYVGSSYLPSWLLAIGPLAAALLMHRIGYRGFARGMVMAVLLVIGAGLLWFGWCLLQAR